MKTQLRLIILLSLPFLFEMVCAGFRSPGTVADIELVRSIYSGMNLVPENKQVFYTRFSITTTLRDVPANAPAVSRSDAEMLVSETQSRYISKAVEVYMDNDDAFTVMPVRKTIYRSDSYREKGREKRMEQLPVLHDSLFTRCRVAESRTVNEGGADRCIILVPKTGKVLYGISRYIFYINTQSKKLEKVITEYPSDHRFERVEIDYHVFDFNYNMPAMFKPIRPLFVTGKNKLQPAYAGYQLVDSRKKNAQNKPQ